jgi:hypothetical protein
MKPILFMIQPFVGPQDKVEEGYEMLRALAFAKIRFLTGDAEFAPEPFLFSEGGLRYWGMEGAHRYLDERQAHRLRCIYCHRPKRRALAIRDCR